MGVVYELYLADQFGDRIKMLTGYDEVKWGRVVNDVGHFKIAFPEDQFDRDLWWGLDRRVEIWRKPEGGSLQLELVGFCRYLKRKYGRSDERYIEIMGPDAVDLVDRRIIAYAAGSSEADKSGYAGDVMKAFVRENLGSSATDTDRDITSYGFSIQADLNDGYSAVNKAASRKNLLATLQDIAEISYGQGTPIYFDIAYPTPSTFEFRTYQDQRGTDRTFPNGENPIILSANMHNLRDAEVVQDWRKEGTYGYGGGQGREAERTIVEVSDTTRLNASAFNRREFFFQGSSYSSSAALSDAALARLRERRPSRKFKGEIAENDGTLYGKDFFFGDRVTAMFQEEQYDVLVASVVGTLNDRTGETIESKLEYLE